LTVKQAEGLDCDPEQGDLIGRIFAYWTIVFSGKFFSEIKELAKIWM
jgi:hypothetical protein